MLRACAVIYVILLTHVHADELEISESCGQLYEKGVEAYLEESYQKCVVYLEKAVEKYKFQMRKLQNCRIKCKYEADDSDPLYPKDIDDLRFFEKAVRATLCVIQCQRRNVEHDGGYMAKEIENTFEDRTPYEYLNLCYYKVNKTQNAANAAFTYLVAHPDSKLMSKNLEYYSKLPGVDMDGIINYEAKDYVYLYAYGVAAYDKKDWNSAINNLEGSLFDYLDADDECRAQCEGPFNHGWYPDFIPSISNHFTYVLKCKRNCTAKLGHINAEYYDDLFPSHYNYLQYAYFKKGNLLEACKAVASYLLFFPKHETMLHNLRYYKSLPKVEDNYFTPRDEALKYFERDTYEKRIIKFIRQEFKFNPIGKQNKDNSSKHPENTS